VRSIFSRTAAFFDVGEIDAAQLFERLSKGEFSAFRHDNPSSMF